MAFTNDKAIYLQMADRLCDEILADTYKDDDRIPSVREYAVLLEVNTNTAVKAYDELARANIIYNKRGLGYFVTKGAKKQIMKERKRQFMKMHLPESDRCAYWELISKTLTRPGLPLSLQNKTSQR